MKNTHTCPKCNSLDLLSIPGGTTWNGRPNKVMVNSFKWLPVTRLVCGDCGYTEEWIDSSDLPKLKKQFGSKDRSIGDGFV